MPDVKISFLEVGEEQMEEYETKKDTEEMP